MVEEWQKCKKLDYLIMQRNQLVDALSVVNDTYRRTVLGFIASLASIAATYFLQQSKGQSNYKMVLLILMQVIILLVIFIEVLLITGNTKRYYICAIDDYIYKAYGISGLFYQGNLSRKHTIGFGSMYSVTSTVFGVLFVGIISWIIVKTKVHILVFHDIHYMVVLVAETIIVMAGIIINMANKVIQKTKGMNSIKAYKDCYDSIKG